MEAAQRAIHELLGCYTHQAWLACMRPFLSAGTLRSTGKPYLSADLVAACSRLVGRQRICLYFMVDWSKHELRLRIARLRGLGFMVAVVTGPRQQCLIAAIIVSTSEYALGRLGYRSVGP